MDSSAGLFSWVLIVSALSVVAVLGLVVAGFAWYQRQALRQAREWGQHLLLAQEGERARIARDLHDDMVQRLWSVRLLCEAGQTTDAAAALGEVTTDLRTLAHDLHPPALRHLMLADAIRDLAARQFPGGMPAVDLHLQEDLALPQPTALALYRVLQECCTNVVRHAGATRVGVSLTSSPTTVQLEVTDNGRGIADPDTRRSFGLRGMRERIEMLGGQLTVAGRPGEGTTVRAVVPA